MAARTRHQQEVDRNHKAFKKMLPELMQDHPGGFALLRDCGLVACFDTSRDAIEAGRTFFDDGIFSVQEIRARPVDLGWYSHFRPPACRPPAGDPSSHAAA